MTNPADRAGADDEARQNVGDSAIPDVVTPGKLSPKRRLENVRLVAPVLIVSGRGAAAGEFSELLADRCAQQGVAAVLKTIDDAAIFGMLHVFPSVMLVLSSDGGTKQREDSSRFTTIEKIYRQQRPQLAQEALRPDAELWYLGGVLHVIFPDTALSDPVATAVINAACANYLQTRLADDIDAVFDIYTSRGPARRDSVAAQRDDEWAQLELWQVTSIDQVRLVKRMIDERCAVLDDEEAFPTMSRPISGSEMNILKLILRDPKARPQPRPGELAKDVNENFMDTGARAIRDVISEIQKHLPGFDRPEHRRGKKGSQEDFRKMYNLLRAVILREE